jgi:hypothetical protein
MARDNIFFGGDGRVKGAEAWGGGIVVAENGLRVRVIAEGSLDFMGTQNPLFNSHRSFTAATQAIPLRG